MVQAVALLAGAVLIAALTVSTVIGVLKGLCWWLGTRAARRYARAATAVQASLERGRLRDGRSGAVPRFVPAGNRSDPQQYWN